MFSQGKYEAAIEAYSQAIEVNPKLAILYNNRALCHFRLKNWDAVIENCANAIQMNPSHIKSHFLLGQAKCEIGAYDDAVTSLTTAHVLAKEQGRNFGDDIAAAIRVAKRKRWQLLEEERLSKQSELQSFLLQLLENHKQSLVSTVDPKSEDREKYEMECDEKMREVHKLFEDADKSRKQREVPEYLIGKISFELMKDPVIAPSGITYDRAVIEEHLEKVGHFDPLTREPLTKDGLIPNYGLKEVLDSFIQDSDWIEEY